MPYVAVCLGCNQKIVTPNSDTLSEALLNHTQDTGGPNCIMFACVGPEGNFTLDTTGGTVVESWGGHSWPEEHEP